MSSPAALTGQANPHPEKHFEMVQAVISRFAGNSLTCKGWCISIVAGLYGLAGKDADWRFGLLALASIFLFAGIDALYLRLERCYRALYGQLVAGDASVKRFDMSIEHCRKTQPYHRAFFSRTILLFYSVMAAAVIAVGVTKLVGG